MGIDSRGIRVNTTKHNRPEPASMKVGSGLLAVVIHFDFACCCCQRVLSHGLLLLSFSLVGVVVFSFAVVTPDHTVAVLLAAAGHKERAARDTLISESPWFQAILPFWQPHLIVSILGFTFRTEIRDCGSPAFPRSPAAFPPGAVCSGWCLPVCPRWITSHIATYIFLFGFPAFYAPFQQGKPVIR